MRDRASELHAIADGRLMLNVRNGVTVSRSMLAMIADEFEALSTALAAKDAELARRDMQLEASAKVALDLSAQLAEEHRYAERLLIALMEKHYPKWAPLPDLMGILTQIDNLTTGLVRAAPTAEAARRALEGCE